MPEQQAATIHGVGIKQTKLQGKWYTPVDARVKIAEQADPALIRRADAGYNVVSVQFIQIADRWAYHCLVEYPVGSGVITPGTDFIDTKDPSGVAKAETSAIGRALGLHGIAIEDSIASAEEMSRVASTASETEAEEATPARVTATPAPRTATTRATQSPAPERQPAPAQRDAGRPTEARAAQARVSTPPVDTSEWTTSDGYDPIGDPEMKRRVHPLGINNMADYEAFLTRARAAYKVYDTAALLAFVSTQEARHAEAVAKTAQKGA